MSIESVRALVKANIAFAGGNIELTEKHLAESLGEEDLPAYIKQNLGSVLENDEAVITIVHSRR